MHLAFQLSLIILAIDILNIKQKKLKPQKYNNLIRYIETQYLKNTVNSHSVSYALLNIRPER
jgi:hypothetical protein